MTTEPITINNPMWQLIKQADTVSLLILCTLLALSIACWSLFLGKLIIMRIKKRQLMRIAASLAAAQTIEDLQALALQGSHTIPGYLITKNLITFKSLQMGADTDASNQHHRIELFRYEAETAVDKLLGMQEAYLSFFSTSAAIAPLLGLMGTIWGLIHSFMRISQYQSADIVTVAPGIAEALIATFAGLLVAIPALVMYNYCLAQVHTLERHLQPVSDKVATIILPLLIR